MAVDSLVGSMPSSIEQAITNIEFLSKIIGGIFSIYVIIIFVNMISNMRRNRLLKKIVNNLEELNKKSKRK